MKTRTRVRKVEKVNINQEIVDIDHEINEERRKYAEVVNSYRREYNLTWEQAKQKLNDHLRYKLMVREMSNLKPL